MKNNQVSLIALVALAISSLACSAVSSLIATPTPLPTSTPIPTNTPVPTNTPEASVSLFEETEFLRGGCFSTTSNDDVKRFAEDGQFHMQVNTPHFIAWTICDEAGPVSDFILEADITTISGPDNNVAGIIFRYNDATDEFYDFSVGADGYYMLAKDGLNYTDANYLVEWDTSSAINLGKNTNHLKLEVVGDTFKYYINDTLLGEVTDSSLSAGNIGLVAGSFDEGNVHVAFDNVKISKP